LKSACGEYNTGTERR